MDSDYILLKEKNNKLNLDYFSLKDNFMNVQKALYESNNQNSVLENNYNEIKSQLAVSDDNEQESKLKIEELKKEILTGGNRLNQTDENDNIVKLQRIEINDYRQEIKELRDKNENLQKTFDSLKSSSGNSNETFTKDLESKIKHYQDENIRISSELTKLLDKSEIMSGEINNFQNQRAHLIDKLNSVNDALNDSNVLTNVFANKNSQDKIDIQDTQKNLKKNNIDLNSEIQNIFQKK